MRWLLRRGPRGKVHSAVKEGGGRLEVMMTSCGLSVRWDLPHEPWLRAQVNRLTYDQFRTHITCKRCLG